VKGSVEEKSKKKIKKTIRPPTTFFDRFKREGSSESTGNTESREHTFLRTMKWNTINNCERAGKKKRKLEKIDFTDEEQGWLVAARQRFMKEADDYNAAHSDVSEGGVEKNNGVSNDSTLPTVFRIEGDEKQYVASEL